MERAIPVGAFFSMMLMARLTIGGCVNDLDCSGALVCIDGECRDKKGTGPTESPPPVSEATPPPAAEPATPTTPPPTETTPGSAGSAAVVVTPLVYEALPAEPAPAEIPADSAPSVVVVDQTARPPAGPAGRAPCTAAADCAEGQSCEGGTCADKPAVGQEKETGEPPERDKVDDGWALGGGVTGFISLAPINAFSALSIVNIDKAVPAVPFGASSLMFVIAMGPLVNGSSKSARSTGVPGVLGLRIPAWITWALSVTNGFVMIGLGAGQVGVHPAHLAATLSLANGSMILFSVESIVTHAQAHRMMRMQGSPAQISGAPVSFSPTISPVAGMAGISGGVAGLGGTF